ncbi:LamG-like jellyroll fold domain-containing protein [Nafulsella turpanensis]|uniref:LamG-like jellyroll fold domain-containing protein n=1 Tax=Nafulsella turpanensis TaxID=1265690 RepID=UPI001269189C|nr:LamG-like jellyroll fold domain-containing protein [Nafulsella turpanensis]
MLFTCGAAYSQEEQQLAFPGAEGFGRFTSGGRGGIVYVVTNLNDSGPGSLRAGIEMNVPRTIVFQVSGTIHIKNPLSIENGDLTIAGQTAPGQGVTIKGNSVVLRADNIIIRYLRFRPGDISGGEPDAIWGREQSNIIIDHCSMSWAVDEVASFYDNKNFTMQWCIISESLYESNHAKGRHGYGGIWGGQGATFHHNLLAHHSSRNPRFNGSRYSGEPELELVDFRNNVIFNWGGNSAYGGEGGRHNIVANYYKPGPATGGEKRYRIVSPTPSDPMGLWYVAENFIEGYPEVTADNWNEGVQGLNAEQEAIARVDEPFPHAPVTTETALEAYASVLENAGANFPFRDEVDARILEEAETGQVTYGGAYGTGKGIIDSQETVGGWPELFSAPAPADEDLDGMADEWELTAGLNPADPGDGVLDADADGYTNLEEYLHALTETTPAAFLPHPTAIRAELITHNAIVLAWEDNASDETVIILERAVGDGEYEVLATLEPNTTAYADEGLVPGQVYHYRLQVSNGVMTSAYSPAGAYSTEYEPTFADAEQLVGYWNFDASSGTVVEDVSVYDNHGELQQADAAAWTTGKAGNALDLTGTSPQAHVLVPEAEQLNFDQGSFSVAFWMKAPVQEAPGYLFHKGSFEANNVGQGGEWYGLGFEEGNLRFAVDDNSVNSEVAFSSEDFLTNEWVQVIAVRDRSDDRLRIYLNGEQVAESIDMTSGGIGEEVPLIIGNSSDLNASFNGVIDEFKVFDYALSPEEAAGLYQGMPLQAFDPWPLNKSAGLDPEEIPLSWSGDAPAYNLYVGTAADNLQLIASETADPAHVLEGLAAATDYFWRVDAVGAGGVVNTGELWSFKTGAVTALPDETSLAEQFNSYPNPFSDHLTLSFILEQKEEVELKMYDMQNRLVKVLVKQSLAPGEYQVRLSAANQLEGLQPGMYICVLETGSRKMVSRVLYLQD